MKFARECSRLPFWEVVLRRAFPDYLTSVLIEDDGWGQRAGIDRIVILKSGREIYIDEKVRDEDWQDFFLETLSDVARETPGWIEKAQACDYIAYVFLPSRRCYLLPFYELRRAWWKHRVEWEARYKTKRAPNKGWETEGVPVPIPVVLDAIRKAMFFDWPSDLNGALDVPF